MTINEHQTALRISAMHLRLMDHVKQYEVFLQHMLDYIKSYKEHMPNEVFRALEDGLKSHERMANIENALSSRFIRIERREKERIYDTETEGYYQVVLGFDDGSEEPVHFDKKQDQLLYILMALCSLKNGLFADFFKKKETDNLEVVGRLIDLIWPNARDNGDYDAIITNLKPNVYFTDIVQKMKAPIEKCVTPHGDADELLWFLPFTHKFGLKRLYMMRMLPTSIFYPKEFQDIVDALPNASNYMDLSSKMPNKPLEGFENIDNVQMHEAMLKEAEAGDVEAMNVVAGNYNYGTGVMEDEMKAFSWWKKAADLGHDESQYYVGAFYSTGDVIPQDYKKAFKYFYKAAQQGYVDAIFQVGTFLRHGYGQKKRPRKALDYFEQAAAQGHIDAARNAAWMCYYGENVDRDYPKALRYYQQLAEQDVDEAYWHLADSYLNGHGHEKDEAKGWEWIEKGIDKGFNDLYCLAGHQLYNNKQYDDAYVALSAAAERGVNTFKLLAIINLKELAGSKTREEAIEWLLKGVKEGHQDCQDMMLKLFPVELKEYFREKKEYNIPNKIFLLKIAMNCMGSDDDKEQFLNLVDAYREVFFDNYLQEINKQLSIHRPLTDDGGRGDGRRHIIVRRSESKRVGYEIVLILANGEEVVINSINSNSLMIYLLAIICYYKSGYSTEMAKSEACLPIITQLYKMVIPGSKDSEARLFIDNFLNTATPNNYYKQYSGRATKAIKDAVGVNDNPDCYLFDKVTLKNRKVLRRMLIDVKDFELPEELSSLAQSMPDAKDVLNLPDNQEVME